MENGLYEKEKNSVKLNLIKFNLTKFNKKFVAARINQQVWELFKLVARRQGLTVAKALELALYDFCQKHSNTANINIVTINEPKIVTNISLELELKECKFHLEKILKILSNPSVSVEAWRKDLFKALKKAARLYEYTQDQELLGLIEKAEKYL